MKRGSRSSVSASRADDAAAADVAHRAHELRIEPAGIDELEQRARRRETRHDARRGELFAVVQHDAGRAALRARRCAPRRRCGRRTPARRASAARRFESGGRKTPGGLPT